MSDQLVDELCEEIAAKDVVVLVGAGVSLAATDNPIASWLGLLEHGIDRVAAFDRVSQAWIDKSRENLRQGASDLAGLVALGEQVTEQLGGREGREFARWLSNVFEDLKPKDKAHCALVEAIFDLGLPVATTNYDGVLEAVGGREYVTWRNELSLQRVLSGEVTSVAHLHGYWLEPRSVVLGVGSYDELLGDFAQDVQKALALNNSLLLIGVGAGAQDANVGGLLDWLGQRYPHTSKRQYVLCRERDVKDYTGKLIALPFGTEFEELTGFLRELRPGRPQRSASTAQRDAGAVELPTYRSPEAPPGFFRKPGEIHAHVDGAPHVDHIVDLVRTLSERPPDSRPFPGKFDRIIRAEKGPQRADERFFDTYEIHTPGLAQQESFKSFATVWLGDASTLDDVAVDTLLEIIESISDQPGAVVELEYVIGTIEGGHWEGREPVAYPKTTLGDLRLSRFQRLTTYPVEIHHSIDVEKTEGEGHDQPERIISDLKTWPDFGGWFIFDKGHSWSYRSSQFAGWSSDYRYEARVGYKRLTEYFNDQGTPYCMHTIVEQVLAIWRGGQQTKRGGGLSIPELGDWERSCPPGADFWVIAANFFGDRSPDVGAAMVENLRKKVTYTYFLRTQADGLRLGRLVAQLKQRLREIRRNEESEPLVGADELLGRHVRCVLLPPSPAHYLPIAELLQSDYFLCPSEPSMGGYQLDEAGLTGTVVRPTDFEQLVRALSPLVEARGRGLISSPDESWQANRAGHTETKVIACTDLSPVGDATQGERSEMLSRYDAIIAEALSMHGGNGTAVRPVHNGYLLMFERAEVAASWAKRVQFTIDLTNDELGQKVGSRSIPIPRHGIALDFGSVQQVQRAHGTDYIGPTVEKAMELARALVREGEADTPAPIGMSVTFQKLYEDHVGPKEFDTVTNPYHLPSVCLLKWP